MKSRGINRLGMALLMAAPLPAAAELNMVEGHWETIVQIQIKGGNFPIPAIKSSRCLTRNDPIPNAQSICAARSATAPWWATTELACAM